MVGGPVVYLGLGQMLPLWDWWEAQLAVSPANADAMAMLQAVISMALTTICWLVTAVVSQPEAEATLVEFYQRARPLGIWGPVRDACRQRYPEEHREAPALLIPGTLVAVLGATWIALAVLACSQLAVGNYALAGLLGVLSVLGAAGFWPLFNWHIRRMEASHFVSQQAAPAIQPQYSSPLSS